MAYFLYFRKRPSVRVSCLRRTFINQPYYRMKRYLNLLFLAAAALCASCARDAVVSDVPPKGEDVGGYDNNVIVPGWVRIRLDDEAAPLRTGVFTRGEADSGNPLLDELAAGLGATEIREVFPTDPRFEERHRKYGLHLWFDITARRAACTADLSNSRTGRCRLSAAFGGERTFLLGGQFPRDAFQ